MKPKLLRLTLRNVFLVYIIAVLVYTVIYTSTSLTMTPVTFGGTLALALLIATLFWSFYRTSRLHLNSNETPGRATAATDADDNSTHKSSSVPARGTTNKQHPTASQAERHAFS